MAHTNLSHRRTHNILLISRLLNQREGASPFTLVLDTLEQTARPLLKDYIRRAKLSKTHVILLAFQTPRQEAGIDHFIPCWRLSPQKISQTVSNSIASVNGRCLLLIDSLMSLCSNTIQQNSTVDLTSFLMSLLQPPRQSPQASLSLVAVYHLDISLQHSAKAYSPSPLSLLEYLATTVITVHSLAVLWAEKTARDRSMAPPSFGLNEGKQGVLIGLKPQVKQLGAQEKGLVLQLEHRRKSGRGVLEWYFLPPETQVKSSNAPSAFKERILLLDDHPLFKQADVEPSKSDADLAGVTFELNLTDRQRLERDGVVLPYFDAQKAGGGTEGGRILYDMGEEDDFDEEEDEI